MLKIVTLNIWFTPAGCKMGAYGEARECPRCGAVVENAEHCCGDQDKRKTGKSWQRGVSQGER